MRVRRVAVAAILGLMAGLGAAAQDTPRAAPPSPILTLDQDRLFTGSAWGNRVQSEIDAASAALTAENRRIEADLIAEEKALTERRATMPPEEFRAAADAFDAKVVEFRQAQDAKARDIGQHRDSERQRFFVAILPILGETARIRGAVAILDTRAVFLSAESIDVTDGMIAAVDAALGDGTGTASPPSGN